VNFISVYHLDKVNNLVFKEIGTYASETGTTNTNTFGMKSPALGVIKFSSACQTATHTIP